ncbi:5-formyltetrahydrofolate cyclo-ligase [Hanstruepera marina]|uniref:5-formyltetrahydrofolate cyclo-ligase n=1 Tax=Hanstruepera marina TaxID=2873265 RepID=UPI001CA6B045|nr:5-formyltetrahydrofolate cyclo-ligase [Hanstruepera marina]
MTKTELRKKYKALRSELTINTVDDLSLKIANNLLKLPIWNVSYYHTFLTIPEFKEVNTDFILNILSGKDKHIVVSKTVLKSLSMINYLLTDSTVIKKSNFNVPEPVDGIEIAHNEIDIAFIPLLAYDKRGNRVGYGKGFYDVFLSQCKPEIIKIGLSFFEPEETIEGIIDTDIPLDYCVTPKNIYEF